jgi:hypothetical protein
VSREIRTFIFDYIALLTSSIVVGAAGMQAWRAALPAMVERGKAWNHNADCEYTDDVMMRTGEETVCLGRDVQNLELRSTKKPRNKNQYNNINLFIISTVTE